MSPRTSIISIHDFDSASVSLSYMISNILSSRPQLDGQHSDRLTKLIIPSDKNAQAPPLKVSSRAARARIPPPAQAHPTRAAHRRAQIPRRATAPIPNRRNRRALVDHMEPLGKAAPTRRTHHKDHLQGTHKATQGIPHQGTPHQAHLQVTPVPDPFPAIQMGQTVSAPPSRSPTIPAHPGSKPRRRRPRISKPTRLTSSIRWLTSRRMVTTQIKNSNRLRKQSSRSLFKLNTESWKRTT